MKKEKKEKKGKISAAGIIVIMLLILILAGIFIGSILQKKPEVSEEKSQEPAEEKTTEPVKELSQSEIEQIKMEIITGKLDTVPAEINKSKNLIIREYLSDCYMIEDLNKKLECYEVYYLNNDESLKKQKEECEALSSAEKTKCLDEYYFKMGLEKRDGFCDAIRDEELRNKCKSMAV